MSTSYDNMNSGSACGPVRSQEVAGADVTASATQMPAQSGHSRPTFSHTESDDQMVERVMMALYGYKPGRNIYGEPIWELHNHHRPNPMNDDPQSDEHQLETNHGDRS